MSGVNIHRRVLPGTTVKLGVGVILRDAAGRVLLEKRADSGEWGLPGGRVDAGETVEGCALREVREETGLDCRVDHLQGVYSRVEEGRVIEYLDNGDRRHLVDVVLVATITGGQLRLSHESERLEFFEPGRWPETATAPSRAPLEDFARGVRGVVR